MINREITYERDVNKSYMKIPAVLESCLDEKLMFRRAYQGILPMEKCYVNGIGQYWYNISGTQALDTYCRTNKINQSFFEMLVLRICSQLELLEWNLIDTNCLVVDPELIFVSNNGGDISFVLYPNTKGNFWDELQTLMEYILSKLNHSEAGGVQEAYHIYNMTLTEGYSIKDLKQTILQKKEEKKVFENFEPGYYDESSDYTEGEVSDKEDILQEIEKKVFRLLEKVKGILWSKRENKEEIPMVVYPDEQEESKMEEVINPTICLASTLGQPRGVLLYEGIDAYPNFELEKENCILGKSPRVRLYLNRETISQFHAKFDYFNQTYYVEDMNSTNGTFVNDEMLNYKEKKALTPGDILRFADVKYRFF